MRAGDRVEAGSLSCLSDRGSGGVEDAVDIHVRTAGFVVAVVLATASAPNPAQAASTPCTEDLARSASAAALKPSEVLLSISSPRAGEIVSQANNDQSITVSVDYWGPQLLPFISAGPVDQYHLVYFLDEDASPYVGTLTTIPRCHPHILHSAATRVTIDNVSHSSHSLTVLLAGSNNVSVNPPVAVSVTFGVR
jgi:hypothetical protein